MRVETEQIHSGQVFIGDIIVTKSGRHLWLIYNHTHQEYCLLDVEDSTIVKSCEHKANVIEDIKAVGIIKEEDTKVFMKRREVK